MHPVLRFLEYDRAPGFKYLVRNLHFGQTVLLINLLADSGLPVMKGWQAVHEDTVCTSVLHQLRCDPVWCQIADSLFPHLVRLSHRDPDIRIENIHTFRRLLRVIRQRNASSAFLCEFLTGLYKLRIRKILRVGAKCNMHSHLGSQYHQRVPGVVSCIAEIRQADSLHSSEMLPNCQQIRKHLRRVKFIGKSVPDRNL